MAISKFLSVSVYTRRKRERENNTGKMGLPARRRISIYQKCPESKIKRFFSSLYFLSLTLALFRPAPVEFNFFPFKWRKRFRIEAFSLKKEGFRGGKKCIVLHVLVLFHPYIVNHNREKDKCLSVCSVHSRRKLLSSFTNSSIFRGEGPNHEGKKASFALCSPIQKDGFLFFLPLFFPAKEYKGKGGRQKRIR